MKSYFMKWCLSLMMLSLLVGCQQEETEFTTQPEEVLQTRAAFEVPLQYPEVPDDAIDVTTVSVLEPGQAYVILGNYSSNLPHYGNTGEKIVVYVLGNWDV
ncbi:MAG: hypothetical protein LUD02_04175 [Tannerellaceae bacterium]|nr:hypothetical protein [Tannerellaceae bacterium]